jgi:hypothetical protein
VNGLAKRYGARGGRSGNFPTNSFQLLGGPCMSPEPKPCRTGGEMRSSKSNLIILTPCLFQCFQRQVEIWRTLRHPNILQLLGTASIGDFVYSVCDAAAQSPELIDIVLFRSALTWSSATLHDSSKPTLMQIGSSYCAK